MPQGALGNLKRDIEDSRIRKEIEDANRICVLAGDFFMATASTQLAEIENQLVVKQISKERTKPLDSEFFLVVKIFEFRS